MSKYRDENYEKVVAIEKRYRARHRQAINKRNRERYREQRDRDPIAMQQYNRLRYLKRTGQDTVISTYSDEDEIKRIKSIFKRKGVWKNG